MRCPRCQAETAPDASRCAACGAPLAFADEPPAPPLSAPLAVDRRLPAPSSGRAPARTAPPPEVPAPAASPVERPAPVRAAGSAGPSRPRGEPEVIRLRRAPSTRRAAAWGIDAAPFAVAAGLLASWAGASDPVLLLQLGAVVVLAAFVYLALSHWLAGATLGKWAVGLRVVGPDARAPGPGRSALRAAAALVGCAALGIGPLLALFTRSGRGPHDLLARTAVVGPP